MQLLTATYKQLINQETIDDYINPAESLQGLCFHQYIHHGFTELIYDNYFLKDTVVIEGTIYKADPDNPKVPEKDNKNNPVLSEAERNIGFLSDVAASGIAQINEISEDGLDLENAITPAIECCRDTALNNGYEICSPKSITEWYSLSEEVVKPIIFVAGSQTKEIRNKRVDAVIELINEGIKTPRPGSGSAPSEIERINERKKTRSKIIFSGKHKARGHHLGIKTQREAQHMIPYFNKIKHNLKYEIDEDSPISEDDAEDTKENIRNSFKKIFNERNSIGSLDIYIISSTFHLIRISKIIKDLLRSFSKNKGNDSYSKWVSESVNRITLVGSEDPLNVKEDNIFKNSDYIKSMYFELFSHHFDYLFRLSLIKKGFNPYVKSSYK